MTTSVLVEVEVPMAKVGGQELARLVEELEGVSDIASAVHM